MKRLTDLEYLKLNKFQAFWYNTKVFFCAIPAWFLSLFVAIGKFFVKCGCAIRDEAVDIFTTFAKGNWAVKISFFIFGFGNFFYGQFLRGMLFLLFEIVFVFFMFVPIGGNPLGTGLYWLDKGNWFKVGDTVGTVQGGFQYDPIYDTDVWVSGDDSVKVMLYGLLTILFIFATIWYYKFQSIHLPYIPRDNLCYFK